MRNRILMITCFFTFLTSCKAIDYDEIAEKLQIDDRISDQLDKRTVDYEDRIQELESEVDALNNKLEALESRTKNSALNQHPSNF